MKIVITAGGTSEKIDDVRTITNSSTGRLGYAVGTAFLQQYADELEAVYYLHGTRARHPEHEKVIPVEIGGVADLQRELGRILAEEKIDAVVHAMAVSDYTVKEVTTLEKIRGEEPEDGGADLSGNDHSYEEIPQGDREHQKMEPGFSAGRIQTAQWRSARRTDRSRHTADGKKRL